MGIAPGVFATDMTAAMKPEAMARMQQAIPVGTLGEAQQAGRDGELYFCQRLSVGKDDRTGWRFAFIGIYIMGPRCFHRGFFMQIIYTESA